MKKRTLGASGALLAGVVLMGIGVGGAASASTSSKADVAKIKMVLDGKDLFFDAPETVEAGQALKIKNTTDPKEVGPHTFSLVNRKVRPKSEDAIKRCEKEFKGICGAIGKWHKVDLDTGEVGENPVEVGKKGWNQQGTLKRKGDSWVAEKEDASFKREVTAPVGKTLHFICAVHPFMQGKVTVVKG